MIFINNKEPFNNKTMKDKTNSLIKITMQTKIKILIMIIVINNNSKLMILIQNNNNLKIKINNSVNLKDRKKRKKMTSCDINSPKLNF